MAINNINNIEVQLLSEEIWYMPFTRPYFLIGSAKSYSDFQQEVNLGSQLEHSTFLL